MYVGIGSGYDFECLLGYWLPNGDPSEPLWLGVQLNSNPESEIRKNVIAAFRDFAKKNAGWQDSDLDNDQEWASTAKVPF